MAALICIDCDLPIPLGEVAYIVRVQRIKGQRLTQETGEQYQCASCNMAPLELPAVVDAYETGTDAYGDD